MKRNSITAIIGKVQLLTMDVILHPRKERKLSYHSKIRRAAVNEIIRLNAEESMERIAGIDFQSGVDGLFEACKKITDDYNETIKNLQP